jgi:hypothetical protein
MTRELNLRQYNKKNGTFNRDPNSEVELWDRTIVQVIKTMQSQQSQLTKIKNDLVALQKRSSIASGDVERLINELKNF